MQRNGSNSIKKNKVQEKVNLPKRDILDMVKASPAELSRRQVRKSEVPLPRVKSRRVSSSSRRVPQQVKKQPVKRVSVSRREQKSNNAYADR